MHWRRLDMRRKDSMPPIGSLVALRMTPTNGCSTFCKEWYDIGQFKTEEKGRKAWWHGSRGVDNPTRLRKHYDIWWCLVAEFDGL